MWLLIMGTVLVGLITAYLTKCMKKRSIPINYSDLHVLITGCDSGFGHQAAVKFDKLGFNIFACCQTEVGIQDIKSKTSDRLVPILVDITIDEDVSKTYETVKSSLPENKGLWGIINNAGIAGSCGLVDGLVNRDYLQCFNVNVMGMIRMNRQFIPLLRKANGRIINVSSMAGKIGLCFASPYCISKFAIEGYSDVLRRELRYHGITVSVIEPGYFATRISSDEKVVNSMQSTFDRLPEESRLFYGGDFLQKVFNRISTDRLRSKDTHKVSDTYVEAMTSRYPKTRYMVGTDANTIFWLITLLPDRLADRILTTGIPKPASLISCK